MNRITSERGSSLVLLIGIVAALAILSTSLVVLNGNVSHNMSTEKQRSKSFAVTEAALDRGMYVLGTTWMTSAAQYDAWTGDTVAGRPKVYSDFRDSFSATEYPDPRTGQFVSIEFVDNLSPIDYSVHYDKGGPGLPTTPDNKMYVIAQSASGSGRGRVMAMVERTMFDMQLPRGVALFAGGNLLSNGGGNNPKITVEDIGAAPGVSVKVSGTIDDETVSAAGIADLTGAAAGSLSEVFPQTLVNGLKATAQANGRYFTSATEAENSPVNGEWSPSGGLSGLCVVELPAGSTLTLHGDLNSAESPGILMVIGSPTTNIDFGGGGHFYGVVYASGNIDKGHGDYIVHGMVVTAGTEDMRGTTNIYYNDGCIAKLLQRFSMNIKLVPNTWRELRPRPTTTGGRGRPGAPARRSSSQT